MRPRERRSKGTRSAQARTTAMSQDIQTILRDGMQRGLTEIGFQRCLELMARMDSDPHREAWFDIFYDRWVTISIVPSTLRRSYKSILYQRILTMRVLLSGPTNRCRQFRHS